MQIISKSQSPNPKPIPITSLSIPKQEKSSNGDLYPVSNFGFSCSSFGFRTFPLLFLFRISDFPAPVPVSDFGFSRSCSCLRFRYSDLVLSGPQATIPIAGITPLNSYSLFHRWQFICIFDLS